MPACPECSKPNEILAHTIEPNEPPVNIAPRSIVPCACGEGKICKEVAKIHTFLNLVDERIKKLEQVGAGITEKSVEETEPQEKSIEITARDELLDAGNTAVIDHSISQEKFIELERAARILSIRQCDIILKIFRIKNEVIWKTLSEWLDKWRSFLPLDSLQALSRTIDFISESFKKRS
jgi:hypothetical protein